MIRIGIITLKHHFKNKYFRYFSCSYGDSYKKYH